MFEYKKILTSNECAQFLGISKSTLYKKTSAREIPFYRTGKLIYFLREDVEAWVLRHRVNTREEAEAEAREYLHTQRMEGGAR